MKTEQATLIPVNGEAQFLRPAEPTQALAISPLSILSSAVERGATIATIERIVVLVNSEKDRQAEIEFNEAMNAAQKEMEPVRATATNPQTKSRYAKYHAIDKIIRPIYVKHGFSLSFNNQDSPAETVKVVCYVAHLGGHTRTYQITMPADGKGAKGGDVMTKTHATGAANSYGKRYLVGDIFNLSFVTPEDVDGNEGGTFSDLAERIEWITNAKDVDELKKLFFEALEGAKKANDKNAQDALSKAKNARYRELTK